MWWHRAGSEECRKLADTPVPDTPAERPWEPGEARIVNVIDTDGIPFPAAVRRMSDD